MIVLIKFRSKLAIGMLRTMLGLMSYSLKIMKSRIRSIEQMMKNKSYFQIMNRQISKLVKAKKVKRESLSKTMMTWKEETLK